MTDPRNRLGAALLALLLVASCAPAGVPLDDGPAGGGFGEAQGPQYAPGDPCRGVVPELCPR